MAQKNAHQIQIGRIVSGWLSAFYLLWLATLAALIYFGLKRDTNTNNGFDTFYGLIVIGVIATLVALTLLIILFVLLKKLNASSGQCVAVFFIPLVFLGFFRRESSS